MRRLSRFSIVLILSTTLFGCSVVANIQLDKIYGPPQVRSRITEQQITGPDFFKDVKPIFDSRCVVCHACYDAPCQLKLSSIDGIDRGASKKTVYRGDRLLAVEPSRLYIDAKSTALWRTKSFHPVLNERRQSAEANLAGSTLYRLLELKQNNPLSDTKLLPDSFDLSLNRKQECPTIEEFDSFAAKHPLWGMPYGLPALSEQEHATLRKWLEQGSLTPPRKKLDARLQKRLDKWEAFLNGETLKQQLVSRYIFEHLFLADLFFDKLSSGESFRLVRSKTPPGQAIEMIRTRRPYEDPGVERFYYRLWRERSSVTVKTHMPYALNRKRMKRWRQLFFEPEYTVSELPSYKPKIAANPFIAFQAIPVRSRYRFMLDEAEFTIMGFIKGPVCRGNTALNVIEDRFWVVFINPNALENVYLNDVLVSMGSDLRLPSAESSNSLILSTWIKYSRKQKEHLKTKSAYLEKVLPDSKSLTLDLIWDGAKRNTNAALTVFRHGDAATVVRGFVGPTPETAWVIGYTLLERIHYLLVAGFDVFGNVGHQLISRLYMDFLRMEGEQNFLTLLPEGVRETERDSWYRDAEKHVKDYITWPQHLSGSQSGIPYKSDNPKEELFAFLKDRLGPAVSRRFSLEDVRVKVKDQLRRLQSAAGARALYMPELSFVRLRDGKRSELYTLIRDSSYSNVSTPFFEKSRRRPLEDSLVLVPGVLGAYPNAFFDVKKSELSEFVDLVEQLESEDEYSALLDRFGVRRNSEQFWPFFDWLHLEYKKIAAVEAGLFDLNRFQNR